MRRKYKKIDPSEFADAGDVDKTTIKGEMRKLYSEINRKLKEGGWSAKDVVAWFNDRGLPISVELFRVYLRDLDKEHGYKRSTGEQINTPQKHIHKLSDSTSSKPQLPSVTTTNKSSDTNPPQASENRKFSNPADVKKARGQKINLDDYEE
jgi:hypothetical protein